jgi:hypothetical protein
MNVLNESLLLEITLLRYSMKFTKTALILLFSFHLPFAQACSCKTFSLGERVIESDIVVVGEVLESKQVCLETIGEHCSGPYVFYVQNTQLLKIETWKERVDKPLGKTVFISNVGNCTFVPQKGEKWLIFGTSLRGAESYTTSVCSGNSKVDGSDETPEIKQINTFLKLYKNSEALKEYSEQETNN